MLGNGLVQEVGGGKMVSLSVAGRKDAIIALPSLESSKA